MRETNAPTAGGCLCGGVRYAVDGELRPVWNCHCERCRRFTGHHMAATAADPQQVRFLADTTLTWHEPAAGVHYGFCRECGSSLFWRADDKPHKLCIAAGSVDQPSGLQTTDAWWVEEAADYHELQADLVEHTRNAD